MPDLLKQMFIDIIWPKQNTIIRQSCNSQTTVRIHDLLKPGVSFVVMVVVLLLQTGQQARFDFNGHLVAVDADVPTHLGLHHHGSEPEVNILMD